MTGKLAILSGKILDRIKAFIEPVGFLFRVVLPLLLTQRRRPVLFCRYMALGDVICTFPAVRQLIQRHAGAPVLFHCREDYGCLLKAAGITARVVPRLNVPSLKKYFSFLFAGIYEFTYASELPDVPTTESVIPEFCRQHGVAVASHHPKLEIAEAARERAKRALETTGFKPGEPLIVIHPGPSVPFREWHNTRWAHLVQSLHEAGFRNVVQLGASRRDDRGMALHTAIPGVISLVDRLALEESIALISAARLMIGIDSGLLHVAASVGTPFVGIFGATSPWFRFANDYLAASVVSNVPCQGCHHRVPRLHWETGCPSDLECMNAVKVEDVLRQCLVQLNHKDPLAAQA